MRRFLFAGVLGLAVAPIAWSSGALHLPDQDPDAFRTSLRTTLDGWFAAETPPERDLTGLLMVAPADQRGIGTRVGLDEIDGRFSDAALERSVIERATNLAQWPAHHNPRGHAWLKEQLTQPPPREVPRDVLTISCFGSRP